MGQDRVEQGRIVLDGILGRIGWDGIEQVRTVVFDGIGWDRIAYICQDKEGWDEMEYKLDRKQQQQKITDWKQGLTNP